MPLTECSNEGCDKKTRAAGGEREGLCHACYAATPAGRAAARVKRAAAPRGSAGLSTKIDKLLDLCSAILESVTIEDQASHSTEQEFDDID